MSCPQTVDSCHANRQSNVRRLQHATAGLRPTDVYEDNSCHHSGKSSNSRREECCTLLYQATKSENAGEIISNVITTLTEII